MKKRIDGSMVLCVYIILANAMVVLAAIRYIRGLA
jgi:hypothetical protein